MKRSIALLDDILKMEQLRDEEHKKLMIQQHRGSLAVGDSAILFYLQRLKELIEEESKSANS